MAGLLLPLQWFSILHQKSLTLLINFILANLTLLASDKHIWSKNWSISSSYLMRVHGFGRPSNIGASKTNMIHWNRFSTIWNEHWLADLGFGWCSVLIIMWGMIRTAGTISVWPGLLLDLMSMGWHCWKFENTWWADWAVRNACLLELF